MEPGAIFACLVCPLNVVADGPRGIVDGHMEDKTCMFTSVVKSSHSGHWDEAQVFG